MTLGAPVLLYRRFGVDYTDTARTTVATVGADVRSATDATGGGNHLVMAAGAVPTLAAGGGLTFASTGGRALQNTLVIAQPFLVLLRFTYPTAGDSFLCANKGTPDSWYLRPQSASFSIKGSGGSPVSAPMWSADSTPRIAGAFCDGTSSKIFVNGTITSVSGTSAGFATGVSVGCYIPGNNALNFPGTITDLGIWTGSYGDTDIAAGAALLAADGTQLSRIIYPPDISRSAVAVRSSRLFSFGTTATPTAPTFGGITVCSNAPGYPGRLHAEWDAASDAIVDASQIRYEVFASQTSPPPTGGAPTSITDFGATSWDGDGFAWDGPWFVIVRARNSFGISDTNTVELVSTPVADTSPPTFSGATFVARTSDETAYVGWGAATDNDPLHDATVLLVDVYLASSPGGQDFGEAPTATVAATLGFFELTGLAPTTTYYVVVRARDSYGNQDSNTVELAVAALVTDVDPPVVGNFSPVVGTPITPQQPVTFDVTDAGQIRRAIITVSTGSVEEVLHNGDRFLGAYALRSFSVPIAGGRRYTVQRSGGWPASPTFKVYAVDTAGNEV